MSEELKFLSEEELLKDIVKVNPIKPNQSRRTTDLSSSRHHSHHRSERSRRSDSRSSAEHNSSHRSADRSAAKRPSRSADHRRSKSRRIT